MHQLGRASEQDRGAVVGRRGRELLDSERDDEHGGGGQDDPEGAPARGRLGGSGRARRVDVLAQRGLGPARPHLLLRGRGQRAALVLAQAFELVEQVRVVRLEPFP